MLGQNCLSFSNQKSIQHCQAILNLCALNLYRNEHETCLLYNDVYEQVLVKLESIQSQETTNTATTARFLQSNSSSDLTFSDNPKSFYSSLYPFMIKKLKYDSNNIFINNISQFSESFSGILRLPLQVNVYDIDGKFLRVSPFEKEFFGCNFSYQTDSFGTNFFTQPIYPGQNFSLDCDITINDILSAEPLLFELFLQSPSGAHHLIPVKLSSLNENSSSTIYPFEDDISKESILSQNFFSRFFLFDNFLTKGTENANPKIIRFARTLDLLFYRAHDSTTGVYLQITYQNVLPDSENLPELVQSFRLAHYSSASPFQFPLLFGKRFSYIR
jgi:hypothetical protein